MKKILSPTSLKGVTHLAVILLLMVSCRTTTMNPIIELHYIKGFNDFTDIVFINQIYDIKYFDGEYYLVDIAIGSVFVLDESFNLINTLGKKGKGPQEFISPGMVQITEENIFIADLSGNFVDCYRRGNKEFLQRIHIPTDYRLPRREFYADDAYNFSVVLRDDDGLGIGMYNAINKSLNHYSGFTYNNLKESLSICKISEDILAVVPVYSRSFHLFSISGKKWLRSIELPLPEATLRSWQAKNLQGNTPIFTDAYHENGFLYIAYQDFANGRRGMAKVTIRNNDLKDVALFHFKERNGDDMICVNGNTVVTYAIGPEGIEVYEFQK